MYKDKAKQRKANREAMRKKRGITEGITKEQGITPSPTSEGITQGITAQASHILDKLTDPRWRDNLSYLCEHMRQDEKEVTWLGGAPLPTICDWLECTA